MMTHTYLWNGSSSSTTVGGLVEDAQVREMVVLRGIPLLPHPRKVVLIKAVKAWLVLLPKAYLQRLNVHYSA